MSDEKKPRRSGADDLLAANLAAGLSVEKAAEAAGVSASTAFRRLRSVRFRSRVDELRGAALEQAVGVLSQAATAAAEELRRLVTEAKKEDTQRIHAIRLALEFSLKGAELVDLVRRVKALEERQMKKGKKHGIGRAGLAGEQAGANGTGGTGAGQSGSNGHSRGPNGDSAHGPHGAGPVAGGPASYLDILNE